MKSLTDPPDFNVSFDVTTVLHWRFEVGNRRLDSLSSRLRSNLRFPTSNLQCRIFRFPISPHACLLARTSWQAAS